MLERSRAPPRPPGSAATTAARGGGCSGRSSGTPTKLGPELLAAGRPRAAASPGCSPGSGCRRCAPRSGWPASRFDGEAARALFAGVAAHSMLRLDRPLSAVVRAGARDVRPRGRAGRWSAAGRRRVATALVAELRGARRRDRHRPPGRLARRAAAGARDAARRDAAAGRRHRRRPAVRGASGGAPSGFRYGPGVFKVDWALDGPGPVGGRRVRAARRRSTWAGRSTRSRRPRRTSPPAGIRSGRTCCSSSTRRGIRRRAPDGKATAWAYCHVPAGSDGGHDRADRGPGRAVRARVPRPDPGARDALAGADGGPRRELRRRRHQRRHPGHPPAGLPAVAVARSVSRRRRAVPVLVVDAARRRRPRDERVHAARAARPAPTARRASRLSSEPAVRPPRPPRSSRRSQSPKRQRPDRRDALQTTNITSTTVSTVRMSENVDWMVPLSSRPREVVERLSPSAVERRRVRGQRFAVRGQARRRVAAAAESSPSRFVASGRRSRRPPGRAGCCPRMLTVAERRSRGYPGRSAGRRRSRPPAATAAAVESSVPPTEPAVVDGVVERVGGAIERSSRAPGSWRRPDRAAPFSRPSDQTNASSPITATTSPIDPVGDQALC